MQLSRSSLSEAIHLGTFATSRLRRAMSAFRGNPEDMCSLRISGDREHGFQRIVSSYFAGS